MDDPGLVALPVGFERFHRQDFVNYQLNRARALGSADRPELAAAAARLRSTADGAPVFAALSRRAAAEGRLREAAGCARLAEFFTPPSSALKAERYRRYRELFDAAVPGLARHEVPYAGAALPAYTLPASGPRAGATVLVHGGVRLGDRGVPPDLPADRRRRSFMRVSVRTRARLSPTLRAVVEQVLYMLDSSDPADVPDWFLGMNARHLGSGRVRHDVLLLCGEHDAFQPPVLTRAQARAFTGARSVTTRMFTRPEQADQHCQMANLELACQVLTAWLRSTGAEGPAPHP